MMKQMRRSIRTEGGGGNDQWARMIGMAFSFHNELRFPSSPPRQQHWLTYGQSKFNKK
jgi:hypothetical protein